MYTWTRIVVGAALLAGCTGTIENPAGSPGAGARTGAGSGTGSSSGAGAAAGMGTGAVSGNNPACTPGVPPTSQLSRLTRAQYDNTTRDLLGLTFDPTAPPSSMLAPDDRGSVDQRAWDGYQTAAGVLATQVMGDAAARAKVIACTPTGDGAACAQQFIQQFGRRAFRRPLTTDEVARFSTLYTNRAQLTATGTFDEAAQLILRAFLLSPSFLTRAEIAATPEGQYFVLNAHEVASRLSYMLWGSMPDDTLFAAADAGKLSTSAEILAQAQRMLTDPKARSKVGSFHEQYALMGTATRWSDIARDPALYPAFSQALVPLLTEETKRFFDYVVFDQGGTFQDLLTKPIAFVNKDLAPIYGLDPTKYGADLVRVDLDPATRAGVFTQAGFLASYSLYNRPSPILRGAFLQKQVLCTTIGAPPPDAVNTPLPTAGLTTNREQVDAQTSGSACLSCHHTLINPTGFALEAYDAIGAYQTAEKGTGAAINTVADVVIGKNTAKVTGPTDLMTKIAGSPEAQGCYARRLVEFAYERALTSEDACTVQTMAGKMTKSGYTVLSLITDLTQSQSFRYRAMEVAP